MSDIKPHPFGQAVIYFREQKGWKRYMLAKAAGRQGSEIKRIEEAQGSPEVDTLIWVAKALDIPPSVLLDKMLEVTEND